MPDEGVAYHTSAVLSKVVLVVIVFILVLIAPFTSKVLRGEVIPIPTLPPDGSNAIGSAVVALYPACIHPVYGLVFIFPMSIPSNAPTPIRIIPFDEAPGITGDCAVPC